MLAEELHFGRAAARLHLGQPSLSQQLQRLERHVGVELVQRSSHHVRLTAAGQAFRADAAHPGRHLPGAGCGPGRPLVEAFLGCLGT